MRFSNLLPTWRDSDVRSAASLRARSLTLNRVQDIEQRCLNAVYRCWFPFTGAFTGSFIGAISHPGNHCRSLCGQRIIQCGTHPQGW